jgi:membrane-associated phospholipid phosphatase
LGRASLLTGSRAERAWLTLSVAGLFVAGYFGVSATVSPARARTLGTAIDASIPFVAGTVWLYLLVFPASLLPLFVVRSQTLFRRAMAAYAVAIAASLVLFAAIPVTSVGLRVDPASLDRRQFSSWAVAQLYAIDPPFNLFPSLHLSIATLSALAAWKARRLWGAVALGGVSLIAISIATVKQHFVVDALGGALLAGIVYAAILAPYAPGEDGDPAFRWPGPAAFLVLVAAAGSVLYVWFRLGS